MQYRHKTIRPSLQQIVLVKTPCGSFYVRFRDFQIGTVQKALSIGSKGGETEDGQECSEPTREAAQQRGSCLELCILSLCSEKPTELLKPPRTWLSLRRKNSEAQRLISLQETCQGLRPSAWSHRGLCPSNSPCYSPPSEHKKDDFWKQKTNYLVVR